jgi:hypothetical protein
LTTNRQNPRQEVPNVLNLLEGEGVLEAGVGGEGELGEVEAVGGVFEISRVGDRFLVGVVRDGGGLEEGDGGESVGEAVKSGSVSISRRGGRKEGEEKAEGREEKKREKNAQKVRIGDAVSPEHWQLLALR